MYVCRECWRAEMKFKWAFFFKCLLRFFQNIFRHETFVECRKIVEKIEKSMRKKACLNFIGASQHLKQTYIGNFVYQGVALNTLAINGLSRTWGLAG